MIFRRRFECTLVWHADRTSFLAYNRTADNRQRERWMRREEVIDERAVDEQM